ncbi:MAG TPA: AEC family transporter [Deltaproteobacteria bacterium]|nr:AEC family transporter [Deltaproteobacteria bacterium]HOM29226.1 AEC family transporter [Deltaproteobacteria bacterium]HPP79962.1 AEC family transporter [Deltaproteobacteria bacterium]
MGVFAVTFTAVAMLLTIGILGYWMLSRRVIAGEALKPLSVLAIDIALPCLTFTSILKGFDPADNASWWTLPLWWLGSTAWFTALALVSSRLASPWCRREFTVALLYQNAIFFPLAIIVELEGTGSALLVDLFLYTLFFPAFLFNTAPMFFAGTGQKSPYRILNPVLAVTLAGIAIRLFGVSGFVPAFLADGLSRVGAMAVPLLMLVLGGNIYLDMLGARKPAYRDVTAFVCMKNLVFPAATLGMLLLVRPPHAPAFIIMLQASVPPVTAVPIIVEREGGDRNVTNQFMVASFLFSLVSIPAMIALFTSFFPG